MNHSYFKTFLLATFTITVVYGCQPDKTQTAKVQPKVMVTKAPERKPDSVMKYVKGPSMPAVTCCRGFPSRAKVLAAKK